MKCLAIDYGLKRTGLAVSDPLGTMAFPRRTVYMTTREAFFAELLGVIDEEAPDCVVIGLPLTMDGDDSLTTRQVRNFCKSLARRTSVPLYWMEELLSSFEAEADLREAGRCGRAVREVVDQQAAVRILESFLSQPKQQWRRVHG